MESWSLRRMQMNIGFSIWGRDYSRMSYAGNNKPQNQEQTHLEEEEVRQSLVAEWVKITAHHTLLLEKMSKFKTNWDTVFNMPVLLDKSYPTTMNLFNTASIVKETASSLPNGIGGFDGTEVLVSVAYVNAVHNFSVALSKAEEYALLIGQQGLPFAERQKLQTLQGLLKRAIESPRHSIRKKRYFKEAFDVACSLKIVQVPESLLSALKYGDSTYQTFPDISVINTTVPMRLVTPPTTQFLLLAASSRQNATQVPLSEASPLVSSVSGVAPPTDAPTDAPTIISPASLVKNEFLPAWGTEDGKSLPKSTEETVTVTVDVPPVPESVIESQEEPTTVTTLQEIDVWAIPTPFSSSVRSLESGE